MTRKVLFPGHGTFWFLDDGDGEGPLAPMDHCDESGELLTWRGEDSYAHVSADGIIKRYRQVIGRLEDLKEVV
jgi:hypothetical protein